MRTLLAKREIVVPDGVKVTVKSRDVTVEGPRGKMQRAFKHINIDLRVVANGKKVRAEMWHGNRKELATVRSLTTHIKNMIIGVTQGYRYKMRLVYAHFPINVSIEDNGKMVSIRNFLGNKIAHDVKMIADTTCKRSAIKDELIFEGNSVEAVAQTCADIHGVCKVRNKDIRKFLDGIYVSQTGLADEEE
jgi:large subunit ribosomal protein L9e